MGRQPPAGVTVKEGIASTSVRVDDRGFVLLSDWDVERIATLVAEKLRAPATAAPAAPESYVPVHRNAPKREYSEY